jgi:hypothetical protein
MIILGNLLFRVCDIPGEKSMLNFSRANSRFSLYIKKKVNFFLKMKRSCLSFPSYLNKKKKKNLPLSLSHCTGANLTHISLSQHRYRPTSPRHGVVAASSPRRGLDPAGSGAEGDHQVNWCPVRVRSWLLAPAGSRLCRVAAPLTSSSPLGSELWPRGPRPIPWRRPPPLSRPRPTGPSTPPLGNPSPRLVAVPPPSRTTRVLFCRPLDAACLSEQRAPILRERYGYALYVLLPAATAILLKKQMQCLLVLNF